MGESFVGIRETNLVRVSQRERRVLGALANCGTDFGYLSFVGIAKRSGIEPYNVRRVTRSLARKGLAEFGKGLWTDDGSMAGSGYCATLAGREFAKSEGLGQLADADPNPPINPPGSQP